MAKPSKNDTTEILVAIGAVVFIFSLIGVLNIVPEVREVEVSADVGAAEEVSAEEEPVQLESAVTEVFVDEASPAAEVSAESAPLVGTPLSPSVSNFEVS